MIDSIKIFKALADETRFKIFTFLLTHDLCVGALAHRLRISEAAVSQHLKQLRKAGLIIGEKRGYWTHYDVERTKVKELARSIQQLLNLPHCSEGVCVKNVNHKIDCFKEGRKMCECKCEYPERLKGKPEDCTPEQIKQCHGREEHPCEEKKTKKAKE